MSLDELRLIQIDQIIEAVSTFDPVEIIGKSQEQIFANGMAVFTCIPGCLSASLYEFIEVQCDFTLQYSTGRFDNAFVHYLFETVDEAGCITECLNLGNQTEHHVTLKDGTQYYVELIPLTTCTKINGLIILCMDRSYKDQHHAKVLIKEHSAILSNLFANFKAQSETERVQEYFKNMLANETSELERSMNELKNIIDSVHTGIMIVDPVTELIVNSNAFAAKLIGVDIEDLIFTQFKDHFLTSSTHHPGGDSILNKETLLKKANGSALVVSISSTSILIGDREFIINSFVDISDRKKLEDSLEQSRFELEIKVEQRTAELEKLTVQLKEEIEDRKKAEQDLIKLFWALEQSPVGILISNADGIIEFANPSFSQQTGFKFEKLVGSNLWFQHVGIRHPYLQDHIFEIIKTGIGWIGELELQRENGEWYWASIQLSAIKDVEGEYIRCLIIHDDITEAKQAITEIQVAKKRAEESNRLKNSLLNNMSHEFRTPLIAILGFSQILAMDLADPDQLEFATKIYGGGKRLMNTLENVLLISQLEATEVVLKCSEIHICPIIDQVLNRLKDELEKKQIELFKYFDTESDICSIDQSLFEKAFFQLYENAIKYTHQGAITINVRQVKDDERAWVVTSVQDTGIGIREDDFEIIFEEFRQGSEGLNRSYEGCGLGLTLTKRVAELMGGKITLESKVGVGSTFSLWFPCGVPA